MKEMTDHMDPEDPMIVDLQKSIKDLDKAQKRVRLVVPDVSVRPLVKRAPGPELVQLTITDVTEPTETSQPFLMPRTPVET